MKSMCVCDCEISVLIFSYEFKDTFFLFIPVPKFIMCYLISYLLVIA
jgi:hypothetical protein